MIKINEVDVQQRLGDPFSFEGIFSNQLLSGINLNLPNIFSAEQRLIESIIDEGTVNVSDPFSGREYRATIRMVSSSFTVGQDTKSYTLELKEVDSWVHISEIEIEGEVFPVIKYDEFLTHDDIGRKAVLRLDKKQFISIRSMLLKHELSVRRVGVDNEPLKLRFGSKLFWSKHDEEGSEFWKHIIRLYPVGSEGSGIDVASAIIQQNLSAIVVELSSKLNVLINALAETKAISDELKAEILGNAWKEKVNESDFNAIWDSLEQVIDAELDG